MGTPLFEIATDRAKLTWSARGTHPHAALGRLRFEARRRGVVFKECTRCSVLGLARSSVQGDVGAALREQTDYQIFVEGIQGHQVNLVHRDPLILRDLQRERGGEILHGTVNFASQIGLSEFVLTVDDAPELSLEVEVFPTKLDYQSDYVEILADVQNTIVGLALEYLRATRQKGQRFRVPTQSQLEWVLLLSDAVGDLEQSLLQIASRPLRGLTREATAIRAEQVKRVDPGMRAAIRRGAGAGGFVQAGSGLVVRQRLPERRARPTLDTPEHRWLATQVAMIQRRLARIRRQEAVREATLRHHKALQELADVESRISRAGRLEPLASAFGPPPSGFASLTLIGAPGYREAYKACIGLTLGLRITDGPLGLSVKDLSLLYEYWCYLALLRIVSAETGAAIDPRELLSVSQNGLRVLLRKGKETAVNFSDLSGRQVTVTYNPLVDSETTTLIPQRPDMLVTISQPPIWPRVHMLLDAKYRVDNSEEYSRRYGSPGPPEEALNVLHRYRDAIIEWDLVRSGRKGRTVVVAAAAFPHRDNNAARFAGSRLWKSFEQLGVGAVPLLPGSTEYLQEWVHSVVRKGGWALADHAVDHQAIARAHQWRAAASEHVLVGPLRPEFKDAHLAWVQSTRSYFMPLLKSQSRQYSVRRIALYETACQDRPGAVRFHSQVREVEVVRRAEIQTPWPTRMDEDALYVIYRLGEFEELHRPIINEGESGRGQRFSSHRWTSRLAFERAKTVSELLLETEAEWRLYEDLRAAGVRFLVRAADLGVREREEAPGHARFVGETEAFGPFVVRFLGPSGFQLFRPGDGGAFLPDAAAVVEHLIAQMSGATGYNRVV